jgi:predicted flap endonuclease-1-like 5' DNA nuclease
MTPLIVALIAVIMLLLGFLLGWFVEWRIDVEHWRSYVEEEKKAEAATPNPLLLLPTAEALQLPAASQDLLVRAVKEQLAQRDADIVALRATIEQLGATEAQRRAHEAELMEEARRLREQVDELTLARNDSDAEWRHELARREQQWQESKEGERAALHAENERLQAELEAVREKFERFRAAHAAGLAAIRGIGPKLEADLRRVGINSYAELASRTPDELQLLLNPPRWRKLDFDSWIAQAAVLAKNEAE